MLRFFTINTVAELICFIVAIICLIKDKDLAWVCMIPFLLITCIAEMIGIYLKGPYLVYMHELSDDKKMHVQLHIPEVHSNIWVYNILLIFETGFVTLMFSHILVKNKLIKPIIISGLILIFITYCIELLVHGIFDENDVTTTIMSILFALYSFYYFYQLFKVNEYVDLRYSPNFWWVVGSLFFYFGRIACLIFFGILSQINPKIIITYPIYRVLNIILYSCWTYSFICKKWLTKTSETLS
jgi:hypothetical protein